MKVQNRAYSNSFIKLSLKFWSLYCYLNDPYSGRYGDLNIQYISIKKGRNPPDNLFTKFTILYYANFCTPKQTFL